MYPDALRRIKRTLLLSAPIVLILNGFFVAAQWWAVSPNGSEAILWLSILLIFPLIFSLAMIPVAILLSFFTKIRRYAFRIGISCAVYFLIGIVCINIGQRVRMNAFHKLALRSRHLIEAIKTFETKHGISPPTLDALVPLFLPSVPSTGMAAYPKYEYIVGEEAEKWENNPWVVYVETPSGGLNWDIFMYLPKQNYPQKGFGGVVEKVDDWAYVHE